MKKIYIQIEQLHSTTSKSGLTSAEYRIAPQWQPPVIIFSILQTIWNSAHSINWSKVTCSRPEKKGNKTHVTGRKHAWFPFTLSWSPVLESVDMSTTHVKFVSFWVRTSCVFMMESVKMVFVGNGGVGKTCFIYVHATGQFPDWMGYYDNMSTNMLFEGKPYYISYWVCCFLHRFISHSHSVGHCRPRRLWSTAVRCWFVSLS
jgi:hypothetical protein